MSLRNVNLNLLPILRSLLKTASVSRSAAALHLSQPTVSDALAKLRVLLNDKLLVRIGSTMKLTQRAMELIEPVNAICDNVELMLRTEDFDPATVERDLVIASSDICAYLLVRRILDLIRARAPKMTLHLVEIDYSLRDRMAAGEVDFVLLPEFAIEDLAPAPLRYAPMTHVEWAVLMWNEHPLAARESISVEDLLPYPLIAFHPDPVLTDPKYFSRSWQNRNMKIEVRVGQMLLIPHLLLGSKSVALVLDPLAREVAATHPLVVRPNPVPGAPDSVGLAWSPVYDGDPVHRWIREALQEPT